MGVVKSLGSVLRWVQSSKRDGVRHDYALKAGLVVSILMVLSLPGCPPLSQEILQVQFQNIEVDGSEAVAQLALNANTYQPTALLMTLEYDPTEVRVTAVLAGAAAQSAGKVVDWGITGSGQATIAVLGLNEIAIPAGTLAVVHFEGLCADGEPILFGDFTATAANATLEDYAEIYADPLSITFMTPTLPMMVWPGLLLFIIVFLAFVRRKSRWAGVGLMLVTLGFAAMFGWAQAHGESVFTGAWGALAHRDFGSLMRNVRAMALEYQSAQGTGAMLQGTNLGIAQHAACAAKSTESTTAMTSEGITTLDINQSGIADQRDLAVLMDNYLGRDVTLGFDVLGTPAWWLQLDVSLFMRVPIISEMAPASAAGPADEDGDHPAWMEIGNYTDETLDLTGFELHVGEAVWTFPSVQVPAHGCRVVFMSGKDRSSGPNLHTNFAPVANEVFDVELYGPGGEDFCAHVSLPVMQAGRSWKYKPFEYKDSVTPYAARTTVAPTMLTMMRAASVLYTTSLTSMATAEFLYEGGGGGPDEGTEYYESDDPTAGVI